MADKSLQLLRAHFVRHNVQVLAFALVTAIAALAFWAAIYFMLYWLLLLALTVASPMNARVPPNFAHVFFASALVLCALCWLAHRLSPNEMPRDKKSPREVALDILLAVPRMTMAVWGNLRALQFLNQHELRLAHRLLQAIAREHRLQLHSVPVEIPDESERVKILFALQITGLIEMQKRNNELTLILRDKNAETIAGVRVKLQLR